MCLHASSSSRSLYVHVLDPFVSCIPYKYVPYICVSYMCDVFLINLFCTSSSSSSRSLNMCFIYFCSLLVPYLYVLYICSSCDPYKYFVYASSPSRSLYRYMFSLSIYVFHVILYNMFLMYVPFNCSFNMWFMCAL
jgi:hypothetical protein